MAWTNGLILGLGALLVTIPIILHFLMQPQPKQIDFPALRFLKERQQSNRSRMRLRHLLLLLMRCLLIGLLALALAGPSVASREYGNWLTLGGIGFSGLIVLGVLAAAFFRSKKNWLLVGILAALLLGHVAYGGWSASKLLNSDSADVLGDSQAPIAALIVIDTSPRMEYINENQSRLEVAKEMSEWLIGQFPADSQVCVLATDNDRPFFSVDIAAAKRRLETLETTFVDYPIPSALAEGLQILEKTEQERKEIYILSDLTLQSWVGNDSKPVLRRLKENPEINLFVVDVGIENPTNFALSSLELSSSEITQASGFDITTQIARNGGAAQRSVKLIMEKPDPPRPVVRDGKTIFPQGTLEEQASTLDVRENGSAEVTFHFEKSLPSGTYHGRIEIEGQDGLAIDDQKFFTFRVSESWRVLIVHPKSVNERTVTATIAPKRLRELGASLYDCDIVSQEELSGFNEFNDYDAVFLLDPTPIGEPTWKLLDRFVVGGGGLGICLGKNAARGPFAHESFLTDSATRLLTGKLDQQFLNETNDLFVSPQDLSHSLFKTFRNNETGMAWNLFPVRKHWGIEMDELSETLPTQTLIAFSNREPALIERRIGSGRVLVMTTPISERSSDKKRWNDLYVGKFVPIWMLVRAMTAHLVQDDTESLNIGVGQVAKFDNNLLDFPESYVVFTPQDDKPPTTINTIKSELGRGHVRYRFTDYPGQYRMKGVEDPVLRGFSVNLSDATTDLTRVELDNLDTVLGVDRYQMATQRNEIQRQQGTTRRGQEFYPLLMLMMLVAFAVEYLLSNRFYSSR